MDRYDYGLPESAIAQIPLEDRSSARLLDALDPEGRLVHRRVADLPCLLDRGDLLVVNETRVIPARLFLTKQSGARVEILLLEERESGDEAAMRWECLLRPLKRCPPGTVLLDDAGSVVAVVGERCGDGGRVTVAFPGPTDPRSLGSIALPPYIHQELDDAERYQTVYARRAASVAAPTAGLHFTPELLEECRHAGAEIAAVDLAVGLDTFRPVSAERAEDHRMHSELYSIPPATMDACERADRVVAIGTTTVRALEAAALTGSLSGRTGLYIYGRFPFRVVDVLMTNFHIPRSTLLLLLESFCGTRWREIYGAAKQERYRFLSFGDAMIVGRHG